MSSKSPSAHSAMEMPLTTVTVQADGVVDLGFAGDVYLSGLTLAQAEEKIAQHLDGLAARRKVREPLEVSVRLVNGSQSKYLLRPRLGHDPGQVPGRRQRDRPRRRSLPPGFGPTATPSGPTLSDPTRPTASDQILKIDWEGIKERGDTMTNYQIFPGDRLIVPGGPPARLARQPSSVAARSFSQADSGLPGATRRTSRASRPG